MINAELLTDILSWAAQDHLIEEGSADEWGFLPVQGVLGHWNQGSWATAQTAPDEDTEDYNVCGSAFCIAGQVAAQQRDYRIISTNLAAGAEYAVPVTELPLRFQMMKRIPYLVEVTYEEWNDLIENAEGRREIYTLARERLGIHSEYHLFGGDNDIVDVISIGCIIAAMEGVRLDLPPYAMQFLDFAHGFESFDNTGEYTFSTEEEDRIRALYAGVLV